MLNSHHLNPPHPNPNESPQSAACSQASADLTLALNKQALPPAGKWKSTTSAARCLPTVSRTPSSLLTCERAYQNYRQWTLLSAASPVKTVSIAGKRRGLAGKRTGLFFDAMHIVDSLKPRWVVLENVTGLLNSNDGKDFQTVIQSLAECGYLGAWRVLNAAYFGVPTKRRRVFMVAGLGELPPAEFMADTAPIGLLAQTRGQERQEPHTTLLAGIGASGIDRAGSDLIVVRNGRSAMVERARAATNDGLCLGLDETNAAQARAAGNAVCPPVARWIAEKLIQTF